MFISPTLSSLRAVLAREIVVLLLYYKTEENANKKKKDTQDIRKGNCNNAYTFYTITSENH
jgi:hypothetical protein